MKFIINKKSGTDSITLDLDLTATVNDLFLTLYEHRSKGYQHLSFSDYQKNVSLYQYFLYGEHFKKKWLPETAIADYSFQDPCHLTWEEFSESQCVTRHHFWQASPQPNQLDCEQEVLAQDSKPGC